jgi:hypothetical protein
MKELVYEAGITLKIPGTDYGMAKPIVRFTVDVEGDVDEQIAQHKAALEKVGPAVDETLAQQLANITGLAVEGYGLASKVADLDKLLGFTITEMKRQKKALKKAGIAADEEPEEKPKAKSRSGKWKKGA